jgi:hypothetical protein
MMDQIHLTVANYRAQSQAQLEYKTITFQTAEVKQGWG